MLTHAAAAEEEIHFDLAKTNQTFQGFGVHIWATDIAGLAELEALNMRYIRITKDSATWDQMRDAKKLTDRLGIKWLYSRWRAPKEFTDGKMLTDAPGYARYWKDLVAELEREGVRPHFVDLMNEPDSRGNWSTGIAPEVYNDLVKLVRAELDTAGYKDIGIVGPGVTHLDWEKSNKRWLNALDAEAVKCLVAFSTHSWDDGDLGHGGANVLEANWPVFSDNANAKDAAKPKWITEYATKEPVLHGVRYPHSDNTGGYSMSHTMAYATRVYENTLAHLNCGAQVLYYWSAQDAGKAWGYVDRNGEKKAIYDTLSALYPKIPVGARVVAPPAGLVNGELYAGAFVKDGRTVVCVANDKAETRSTTIRLSNLPANTRIVEALACVLDQAGDPEKEIPDTAKMMQRKLDMVRDSNGDAVINVSLPRDSTLTITLE
jgi:hypothetical protein